MKHRSLVLLLLPPLIAACQTGEPGVLYSPDEIDSYRYEVPTRLTDGWETAKPATEHISLAHLEEGARAIMRGEYPRIHSILVAWRRKLVFEEYFPGYTREGDWTDFDRTTPHGLASISKSITTLVFGAAYDQGYIKDIDTSVLDWYPEYDRPDRERKKEITLRHLLTMQSGLKWNEHDIPYGSPLNDMNRLIRSRDPANFTLKKKLVDEPGTRFSYNCGCTHLLADIVFRSTGMHFNRFAEQNLFRPLGIDDAHWFSYRQNRVIAGPQMDLLPRDLLKIGQLILQNGEWEGRQIISENWLSKLLHPSVFIDEWDVNYGLQWWLPKAIHPGSGRQLTAYVAGGTGGQWLMIYPELDCILVITGGNYDSPDASYAWHDDYFLPALQGG